MVRTNPLTSDIRSEYSAIGDLKINVQSLIDSDSDDESDFSTRPRATFPTMIQPVRQRYGDQDRRIKHEEVDQHKFISFLALAKKIEENFNHPPKTKEQMLVKACADGDVKAAVEMIGDSVDVNYVQDGKSVLMTASTKGHLQIVKEIINKRAAINFERNGKTALIEATENGHLDVVCLLIKAGANINSDSGCESALMKACKNGHMEIVKVLVDKQANVNYTTNKGKSALMLASREGYKEIVEYLHIHGAKVNQQDVDGATALMFAQVEEHFEIKEFLKDVGAEHNWSGDGVRLYYYVKNGNFEKVRSKLRKDANPNFKNKDNGKTPLMIACKDRNQKMIQTIILSGADVSLTDHNDTPALFYAVKAGDLNSVKLLVQKHDNTNHKDKNGQTALLIACEEDHTDIVEFLLTKKVDIKVQNKIQMTPMLISSKNGNKKIMKMLLKADAQLCDETLEGIGILGMASINNNIAMVTWLLASGKMREVDVKDKLERTPLYLCSYKGLSDMVKLLHKYGANLNHKDADNTTALMVASQEGHLSIIEYLLKNKVDHRVTSKKGLSAHSYAVLNNKVEVVSILETYGCGSQVAQMSLQSKLLMACFEGNEVAVQELLVGNNHLVNSVTFDNKTPIMLASQEGFVNIIKVLQDKGADINYQCETGFNALFYAVIGNQVKVIRYLLDNGSSVNSTDKDGKTPLMIAGQNGYTEIVDLLINYIQDINVTDKFNMNATSYAECFGHQVTFKLLMQAGGTADIKRKNIVYKEEIQRIRSDMNNGKQDFFLQACGTGNMFIACEMFKYAMSKRNLFDKVGTITPLIVATRTGQLPLVKFLVKNGAKVNDEDGEGNSSLSYAVKEKHEDIVHFLIDSKAEVDIEDNTGNTPIFYAAEKGMEHIVNLLVLNEANVNYINHKAQTAMMLASGKGYLKVVKYLVKHGGMFDIEDENGDNACNYAKSLGHANVVTWLEKCSNKMSEKAKPEVSREDGPGTSTEKGNNKHPLL